MQQIVLVFGNIIPLMSCSTSPLLQSGPSSPDVTETEYVLRCILKLSSKTQRVEAMTGTDRAPVSRSDSSFRYSHEGIVSPGPEEAGPEGTVTAQR